MKLLMFLASLSIIALAKPVDGTLTYKLPSGDLVDRDVVLEVPSRGQGEVVLSGRSFEWRTTQFKSFERLGKQVFVAVFDAEFQGMKSKIIFNGTYLKGSNKLIYTGDMFKVKSRKLEHLGVFNFSYDR